MNCNVLKNGGLLVFGCLFGVLFALLPTVAAAQGLEVTAPLSLTSRQEAVQYERYDYNLNRCAVVVVYLDDDNVDFQGDVRSTQYRGNGEWWVWMIQGANWMSVTVPNYTPLRMEFNPLASGKTYEVRIRPAAPKLLLTVAEPFHADISMTDASKYSRLDSKGRTCALVRIGMVLPEAQFTGAVHSKYLNSEWMVWLSPGTTSLTISAQGYQPLTVQFEPVQAAVTYLMTVHKAGETATPKQHGSSQPIVQSGQDFTETAFGINMRMIYVEGGTFTMGCTSERRDDCGSDQSPSRQTTISSYYIGMIEVTQSQWEKVMGTSIYQQRDRAGQSNTYGVDSSYPMYYVSWEEAMEFCARLGRQTGKTYRLPTEAEWEYAARGGKKNEGTKYSGGWSIDDVAWYRGNSNGSTHSCGTKRPNALGLYDMSGNVWEWCEDRYGSQYLQNDNNNPKGAISGSDRVCRGGCWDEGSWLHSVWMRGYFAPSGRVNVIGFRVVLIP